MTCRERASRAAKAFLPSNELRHVEPFGSGLIHETYRVTASGFGGPVRFILQRVNDRIFPRPQTVMSNLVHITGHLRRRALATGRDPSREVVSLVQTLDGRWWHQEEHAIWRMTRFVEGTRTLEGIPGRRQAHQVGRGFGRFDADLVDVPPEALPSVLPGYRDTVGYLERMRDAFEKDVAGRAHDARDVVLFVQDHQDVAEKLQRLHRTGQLPTRVVHGDTKLDNVLLDATNDEATCVIDLDTVGAGTLLQDVGDCIRDALIRREPRSQELDATDLAILGEILRGFACELPGSMHAELEHAAAAVRSITLELAARYVTDYLAGGGYFKTRSESENLDRARRHIQLARRMEETSDRTLRSVEQQAIETS